MRKNKFKNKFKLKRYFGGRWDGLCYGYKNWPCNL